MLRQEAPRRVKAAHRHHRPLPPPLQHLRKWSRHKPRFSPPPPPREECLPVHAAKRMCFHWWSDLRLSRVRRTRICPIRRRGFRRRLSIRDVQSWAHLASRISHLMTNPDWPMAGSPAVRGCKTFEAVSSPPLCSPSCSCTSPAGFEREY
jgi:hypothetical protein